MSRSIRRILIVGGGSAGWLTAATLAAGHPREGEHGVEIAVLESPDVASIGVGEGTWPTMRDTLRAAGVGETDFMRACDATFKQGSTFVGWRDGGDERYHHPFTLPQDYLDGDPAGAWLRRDARVAFAPLVCVQPALCEAGCAPKQFSTPEYAGVANYAYHLDAVKLGVFLRAHCTQTLGVRHIADHMTGVDVRDDGDIAALRTRGHGALEADLFVDCTGLRSLLLGGHCGVPLQGCRDVLFNDRALAVQVPYADPEQPIACATLSTAQRAGWVWDIGLSARRGVGHVYASAYCDDDAAEAALRAYIERSGGPRADDVPTPTKIVIAPGWRREAWHRNCVAVGLSSGFVEPLEASSLVLVELAAAALRDDLPADRAAMDIVSRRFNEAFAYRWERVIDFLKLHYAVSRRRDSDYWRDHANPDTWPARLRELLTLWRHRAPSRLDLARAEEIFPSASYQYVLFGMGVRPAPRPAAPAVAARGEDAVREVDALARRMRAALPGHRAMIDHVRSRGMPRI